LNTTLLSTAPQPDEEAEPRLPPLDADGDDEVESPADYSDLLTDMQDGTDLDDAAADDLEAGVHLEEPADHEANPREDGPLDVGALLERQEEGESWVADESGPEDLDPSLGISDVSLGSDAGEEGLEEPMERLLGEELPPLEADDSLDEDSSRDDVAIEEFGGDAKDLELVEQWHEQTFSEMPTARALAWGEATLFVAGRGLFSVTDDSVERVLPELKNSLGAVASTARTLVVATVTGDVLRVKSDGALENVAGYRDAAGLRRGQSAEVELSSYPSLSPMLWMRASTNVLLYSRDGGRSWHRASIDAPVLALSRGAAPIIIVDGRPPLLMSLTPGAFAEPVAPLDSLVSRVRHGCLLAAAGPVVGIAVSEGLMLSGDEGRSFRVVPGCSGASAITAADDGLFAALFRASESRSDLAFVEVSLGTARRLGTIQCTDADSADELAQVAALAWDAPRGALWAAGGFGLKCWRKGH
jgi:hypothetical protein